VTETVCTATSCTPKALRGVVVVATREGKAPAQATTDSVGAFTIGGLAGGPWTVTPQGGDFRPAARTVALAGDTSGQDFERCSAQGQTGQSAHALGCGFLLEGRLANALDGGIEFYPVKITGTTSAGSAVTQTILTDRTGTYQTRLDGGLYTVDIDPSGTSAGRWPVTTRVVSLTGTTSGIDFQTRDACGNVPVTRIGTSGDDTIVVSPADGAAKPVVIAGKGSDLVLVGGKPAVVCGQEGTWTRSTGARTTTRSAVARTTTRSTGAAGRTSWTAAVAQTM